MTSGLRQRAAERLPLIVRDAVAISVAFVLAYMLRFDFQLSEEFAQRAVIQVGFVVALFLVVAWATGIYRIVGRYIGLRDVTPFVVAAMAAATPLAFVRLALPNGAWRIPLSVTVMAPALAFALMLGLRMLSRVSHEQAAQRDADPAERKRTLIVGVGSAGDTIARQMRDGLSDGLPVGFVDNAVSLRKMRVNGLPVLGAVADLADVIREHDIEQVVVAGSHADSEVDQIIAVSRDLGVEIKSSGFITPDLGEYFRTAQLPVIEIEPEAPQPVRRAEPAPDGVFDYAVVGLGYVGLPVAVEAGRVGMRVLGFDIDESKLDTLRAGRSYVEDVSDADIANALEAGFVPTSDSTLLGKADTISISVPTPLKDGLPDLGAVVSAARAVGRSLRRGQLVILESTTYPGTTEEVVLPILETESGLAAGEDFDLAYSPERIDPGNKNWGVHNTPRLVGGLTEESGNRAATFYSKFCSEVVVLKGTREAEMAKLLENTYRHVNIALVNELALFCGRLGVDIWEAIRGAATKPFGFQAFYPGPGVGGHCIPIDPGYLSYRVRELGEEARFVELAHEINEYMPHHVVDRARAVLSDQGRPLAGARVHIMGVAYKADVSDVRETPAESVVRSLRDRGALVTFSDPHVKQFVVDGEPVERVGDLNGSEGSDLVILHTPHTSFDLDAVSGSEIPVLDTRGLLRGPNVHSL